MSRAFVLEVGDEPVGLLVDIGQSAFQFVATEQRYGALDGRIFAAPEHALRAARRMREHAEPAHADSAAA